MERKLAAILVVDVVGYSALMERDEAGTFDRLLASRNELFEPEIRKRHGRIFKLIGDGLLAEFSSVVDAVECAASLQHELAERNADLHDWERIQVRIGINFGEVIVDGKDRYGDDVNVAARLQQLAKPGGICVSEKVAKEIGLKLPFSFEPIGEQKLKNLAEPVRAFLVVPKGQTRRHPAPPSLPRGAGAALERLPLPSLAVLPFHNSSGVTPSTTTSPTVWSRTSSPRSVASRGSRSSHATQPLPTRGAPWTYARSPSELGVRYVLEGSMRRTGDRLRIAAQLVDGGSGAHLWADHFDGALDDVFDFQDRITAARCDRSRAAYPVSGDQALATGAAEEHRRLRHLPERVAEAQPGDGQDNAEATMAATLKGAVARPRQCPQSSPTSPGPSITG